MTEETCCPKQPCWSF